MRPYLAIVYQTKDDAATLLWGPGVVFAKDEERARQRGLHEYGRRCGEADVFDQLDAAEVRVLPFP